MVIFLSFFRWRHFNTSISQIGQVLKSALFEIMKWALYNTTNANSILKFERILGYLLKHQNVSKAMLSFNLSKTE